MLYWIINDTYNPLLDGMLPLGVEIHCSAYAYKFDNPQTNVQNLINYQSFLRFKVINRSDTTYDDCIFSVFTDGDLGYAFDDYIGCDVRYNSYFFYNGFAIDGTGASSHYGKNPPVQSVTILKGEMDIKVVEVILLFRVNMFFLLPAIHTVGEQTAWFSQAGMK
jgi:hypothetical protein